MKVPLFTWFLLMPLWTILFGSDVALVSGQCRSDQQQLLLQLRNSLRVSKHVKLGQWSTSIDCCKWAGIECDPSGHVISLNLSNETISGGLENSTALFSLGFLQRLDLSFNNFRTALPARFADLTNLTYLKLSNAGFVGQIPVQISQLTSLVTLDLSIFSIMGGSSLKLENPNLATLVQNLTQLKELYLDGVNISAIGHKWCQALSSSLPNLQVLSLSNCFLSGPIDSSLTKLQSLSTIRLGSNNFSAPLPEFFAKFSNLTALVLSSSNLTGTFPKDVFQVPTLEILDLSNNRLLHGYLPDTLQSTSIKMLVLSDTNFSGSLPDSIGILGNLSRVELARCNFSGSIPSSTENLTQLVYLDFSSNAFMGSVPPLQVSKNLTHMDLSHNQLTGEIQNNHWESLVNLVYLDLSYNSLNGSIPSSLFAIPSIHQIFLSCNHFRGQVPEFLNVSSTQLDTMDLSSNRLEGPIPSSLFNLKGLKVLVLSSNRFNGTIQLDWIQQLVNLTKLDLSYNNLTVEANATISALYSYPQMSTLRLASCNLRVFPHLRNQSRLSYLDLSDNKINGRIPHWIWEVGRGSLIHLNLSQNLLVDLEEPYSIPSLGVLDLHSNQLQGKIPPPPLFAAYVDYSSNKFTSVIPDDIGKYLSMAIFFSISNNSLTGVIPQSMCNASDLRVLDLSGNNLNGTIPACLTRKSDTLHVLNLRRNNLSGNIPDIFPDTCILKTLDLNANLLEGKVPKSLANCTLLEVLDLGNNLISDIFPCPLKNISTLRVLVLRNNSFSGPIGCPQNHGTWPSLQIVNLAFNNFNGSLPQNCLFTWKAMMGDGNENHHHLGFEVLQFDRLYYHDSVTVTSKGLEMELVKILTVFTAIDFSCNNFSGSIPAVMGQFSALYVLNMSHNALNGQIPPSLGNLSQLESLDLSVNYLTGAIPQQLAILTFLSFLNVSFNNLSGVIPTSTQLQSFPAASFEGNAGLCGPPLTQNCSSTGFVPPASQPRQRSKSRNEFDWQFIVPGLGFGLGAALVAAPLMFCNKAIQWYDDWIDRILVLLLPIFGLNYYTRNDWRIEPEENLEEDTTEFDGEQEMENEEDFGRRYCVFCSKLDVTRKRVVHDRKCTCFHSPLMSSSSSSSSFSSSSSP